VTPLAPLWLRPTPDGIPCFGLAVNRLMKLVSTRILATRKIPAPGLLALLGLAAAADQIAAQAPPQPATPTNALTIPWVVGQVLSNNPSIKAARANWEAMKARVPQARAWEDPRVGVDLERSGTTRLDTLTDAEWMVGQEVPLSGKNRWRGRAAAAEADAALAELRRRELELTARAREACYRLANARAQLELNEKEEALLRRLVEASRLKYEAGARSQADVLMAETEAARVIEARRDIEQRSIEEQTRLNVLMNLPPQAPLGPLANVAIPSVNLAPERMQAMALRHRPEILGAQKKIEAAKARQKLAKRAWIPDPELRVEARQFNGAGGGIQEYDTGVFFSFPWINRGKYKSAIAEAGKMQESGEHELAALQAETLGMVRNQIEKIETLHHHYTLFRDRLLPLARQTVQASEIAYTNDRGTLLELVTAQRTARETESAMQDHLTDSLAANAELEAMVGIELSSPDPTAEPLKTP